MDHKSKLCFLSAGFTVGIIGNTPLKDKRSDSFHANHFHNHGLSYVNHQNTKKNVTFIVRHQK